MISSESFVSPRSSAKRTRTWTCIDANRYFYRRTITKAVDFLHKAQRPEGPWFGSWGICFTYATQFALESLSLVGETYENSASARKACDFLIGKQRADGGWGESYKVRLIHNHRLELHA